MNEMNALLFYIAMVYIIPTLILLCYSRIINSRIHDDAMSAPATIHGNKILLDASMVLIPFLNIIIMIMYIGYYIFTDKDSIIYKCYNNLNKFIQIK